MASFVEMEDTLKADNNGSKKTEIINRILEERQKLQLKANQGLSAEDFQTVQKLIEATKLAEEVVSKAWDYYQTQQQ